jgi:hypothetical protein
MDPPKRLLAAQQYAGKREALQAEAAIKRLSATNKRQLAQDSAAASLMVGGGLAGSEEVAVRMGMGPKRPRHRTPLGIPCSKDIPHSCGRSECGSRFPLVICWRS